MRLRNPTYNAFGTIDVEIEHPDFGWIPFTASPNDAEEHGRIVYQRVMSGEAGRIAPSPVDPIDVLAAELRSKRTRKLTLCDWTQTLDAPLSEAERAAWAEYRQALRAIPEQPGFPQDVTWPVVPDPTR